MDGAARYDAICSELEQRPGVEQTKMMGMPCIKRDGKLVAGFALDEDAMTFKLADPDQHAAALALDGAHLFDPSKRGRPMTQWVAVPAAHADRWPDLAEQALA
jgi:hypothetical protein